MGLLGKSFEEQVGEALGTIRAKNLGVKNLSADLEGKVVTLRGQAPSREVKSAVMREFIALVKADNTVNMITLENPPAPASSPEGPPLPPERIHEVVAGDTLSGIAKTYYGKAGLYMKIFEANRDQLKDPNVIRVGQKLRIPD